MKGDQTSIGETLPLLDVTKADSERALETAKAKLTERKNACVALKAEVEKLAKEFNALSEVIKNVEREAVEAEAEKERLEKDNENDKNKDALEAAMKRLDNAYKEKATKASPEILKKQEDMEKELRSKILKR